MKGRLNIKSDGLVVFMGSMNAMPMGYAIELRKLGYEVLYFVDASRKNTLCRPEMHYPEISFPYPPWIIELRLPTQLILPIFPRLLSWFYEAFISRRFKKNASCYFLNGFFVSLAPFLDPSAIKIGLSHGSDLDVWANSERSEELVSGFCDRSIFKYIPNKICKYIIRGIVSRQLYGFIESDRTVYFPSGFNEDGDRVVNEIVASGGVYVSRYDASFSQLQGRYCKRGSQSGKMNIFSVARFLFKSFPEGNKGYNKGNDIIIEGLAKYCKTNSNLVINLVEKGEDVAFAKQLCVYYGIEDFVVWHKEMPFQNLVDCLIESDVCIDQVGDHWIGAGVYAMWLGLPLIANVQRITKAGVWPGDNPVINVQTSDDVCMALSQLENDKYRAEVGLSSRRFIEKSMNPRGTLEKIFRF